MDQRSNVTEAAEHMAKISLRGSSMGKVNKKKIYKCPYCPITFTTRAKILNHVPECCPKQPVGDKECYHKPTDFESRFQEVLVELKEIRKQLQKLVNKVKRQRRKK